MRKGVPFLNQTHSWELVVQAGQWRLLSVKPCKTLQTSANISWKWKGRNYDAN